MPDHNWAEPELPLPPPPATYTHSNPTPVSASLPDPTDDMSDRLVELSARISSLEDEIRALKAEL